MVARIANNRAARSQRALRPNLFDIDQLSGDDDAGPSTPCNITAVAKRRDGGMRYWCLSHKANAAAKYGKPANKCRTADEPPVRPEEILPLDLDDFCGGVAMWGAVPAVYDTTRLPMDRGTHVHARKTPESKSKDIDQTFRAIQLFGMGLPKKSIRIRELDAIYFMVSSVFGFPMKQVSCA